MIRSINWSQCNNYVLKIEDSFSAEAMAKIADERGMEMGQHNKILIGFKK